MALDVLERAGLFSKNWLVRPMTPTFKLTCFGRNFSYFGRKRHSFLHFYYILRNVGMRGWVRNNAARNPKSAVFFSLAILAQASLRSIATGWITVGTSQRFSIVNAEAAWWFWVCHTVGNKNFSSSQRIFRFFESKIPQRVSSLEMACRCAWNVYAVTAVDVEEHLGLLIRLVVGH